MNLGLIIPFLEKYGGAERYFIECIKIWQHKHTITIYTTFLNRELLIEHGIDEHIQFSQLTPYFEGEHSMLLNSLLLPKMWRKEIGHHDLYHAHLWPTHLINLSPMVWMPHEPLRVLHDLRHEQNVETLGNNAARNIHIYPKYNYDRVENSIYESYLDAIDAMDRTAIPECIVSNSQYTASYLENIYNTPVNDIIYPGVEPEMFIELPIDKNLFVTISQLWPHKRINLLIEAIALTSNTQLLIIGSGPDKERLSTIATRLGIEDRIFFLSGLSNNDLSLILARACAFLFSPINEPFGIVVLEAMAAGIPIIAVNQGGYIEACHPDYAFLLPPFPAAFAEKITYLQQHPEIARAMGAKGRLAVTQFTWENTANQMEAVLLKTWNNFTKKQKKSHAENHKTLIGIQYFLWYGDGFGAAHWNDNINSGHVADKPILGYYSSSKGQTIHFHFDLFEQMNLDYIILNLHIDESGVNGLELISIQHVFDIAMQRESKLRFTIQIAPYSENIAEIERVILMIHKLYVNHPNYFNMDNTPVLFWFWSGYFDGNKKFISQLKKISSTFINIAAALRLPHGLDEHKFSGDLFDGFVPFSPTELSDEKNWGSVWSTAYNNANIAKMRYRLAALSPGYDDSGLNDPTRTNNPHRVIHRKNGNTYQRGMQFIESLDTKPHLIMISTFNELHENTHIEPSLQHGMHYIEMTTEFVKKIRNSQE